MEKKLSRNEIIETAFNTISDSIEWADNDVFKDKYHMFIDGIVSVTQDILKKFEVPVCENECEKLD